MADEIKPVGQEQQVHTRQGVVPPQILDQRNTKFPLVIGLVVLGVIVAGLLVYLWPRSDEAIVATFSCDSGLSWDLTTGHSVHDTFGGQIEASPCAYHHVILNKNGQKIFSVANFTACRDFKTELDLYNGTGQPHWGYRAFPAGAPIINTVAVSDVAVPISDSDSFEIPDQLGFSISNKSGLSVSEFRTASKCLLDHRNELQDVFGSIVNDIRPLSWLALIDESVAYGPGDLPGTAQIFTCKNGFTYRTADENLFSLAPGESSMKKDPEFPDMGNMIMNDHQEAVIGFDGILYQPNHSNSDVYMSLPYSDHRLVDMKKLPAVLTECLDNRGVSLAAYIASLKTNDIVYTPAPESYVPKPRVAFEQTSGIPPTEEQNTKCNAQYADNVTKVASSHASEGSVSKALFYSPTLALCIGVVEIVRGNVTNFETFDAATGETLNASDNVTAFQDWAASASSSPTTAQ